MSVAERIYEVRKHRLGLTQTEFAGRLTSLRGKQVEPVSVSRWERGAVEPSLYYLRQIAELADLPVSWFFEETEDEPEPEEAVA